MFSIRYIYELSLSPPTPPGHTDSGKPATGLSPSSARLTPSTIVHDVEPAKACLPPHILQSFNLDFAAPQCTRCILSQPYDIVGHCSLTSVVYCSYEDAQGALVAADPQEVMPGPGKPVMPGAPPCLPARALLRLFAAAPEPA